MFLQAFPQHALATELERLAETACRTAAFKTANLMLKAQHGAGHAQ